MGDGMSGQGQILSMHLDHAGSESAAPLNDRELIWRLYEDNRRQAQFHEMQRATGTGLIVGGTGALIAAITNDHKFGLSDLPLSIMITILGLFGYFFCLKAYERMRLHLRRCDHFMSMLDGFDKSFNLTEIKNKIDAEHRRSFFLSSRLHLRSFWQGIHVLIFVSGLFMTYAVLESTKEGVFWLRLFKLGG
jgi:hypothetical protein